MASSSPSDQPSTSPPAASLHAAACTVIEKSLEMMQEYAAGADDGAVAHTATAGASDSTAASGDAAAASGSGLPPEGSDIHLELVDPADSPAVTPRSALTTAFSLLRQTSADMAQEAAAVAANIAASLQEEHSETLAALNLPAS